MVRPRVFFDIESRAAAGRVFIELFVDETPKTCENFRQLCTGESKTEDGTRLCYQGSTLHRIVAPEFIVQGGGEVGTSIYGGKFEDENLGWRKIDAKGLVCMANSGPDTNESQFFITVSISVSVGNTRAKI